MTSSSEIQALANQRQHRLSERCLEAIVNAADLVYKAPGGSQDYAGIDYTVDVPIALDPDGGPVLSVQLKSVREGSGRFRRIGERLSYDLEAATHDRLTDEGRALPTVLVLVVFPRIGRWLDVEESRVILTCTPYMIDLRGNPRSGNASRKAVEFGSSDRLDPESLSAFLGIGNQTNL